LFLSFYIKIIDFQNLLKNGNMLSNKGSKSMYIKLLMLFYTMTQLPINRILMGLITYFMFEAQINYMWSLENYFKMSEILGVSTFYTICNSNLP
jgi:uncharacterized membrane protein YesL